MAGFNRVKVTTSSSAGASDPLPLGAATAGCSNASAYDGRSGIPYVATWGSSYEVGYGSLSGSMLTRTAIENDLGTTDAQAVPSGAVVMFVPLAQNSLTNNGISGYPQASGSFSLAGGSATASGPWAMAIGVDAALAAGDASVALGAAIAEADHSVCVGVCSASSEAVGAVAVGSCDATHPGQVSLGVAPNEFIRIGLNATTTNATATAVLPVSGLSTPLTVPEAEVWYVKARVIGTVFDGSSVPTKVIVRELSCIAQSTGMLGSLTASSPFNYGSSTATATMTISAAGVVTLTVTGIASTTVQWSVAVEIQRSTIA